MRMLTIYRYYIIGLIFWANNLFILLLLNYLDRAIKKALSSLTKGFTLISRAI